MLRKYLANRFAALSSSETESSSATATSKDHTLPTPGSFTLPQSKFTFTSTSNVSYASAVAKPIPAVIKPTKHTTRVFRRSLDRLSNVASSGSTQTPVSEPADSTHTETKLSLLSLFTADELGPSATPATGPCPTKIQPASHTSSTSPSRSAGTEEASHLVPEAPQVIEGPARIRNDGPDNTIFTRAPTSSSTGGWPAPSGDPPAPLTADRKSRFFPTTPLTRPLNTLATTITPSIIPGPSLKPTPQPTVEPACQANLPRLHGRSMSTIGEDSKTEWGNARMMPSDQIANSGRSLGNGKVAHQQSKLMVPRPAEERDDEVEESMAMDEDEDEDEGYFTAGSSTEVGSDLEGRDAAFWA